MSKSTSLIPGLFLSSMLLWDVATATADERIVKTPLDLPGYCHMQFPEMRSDTFVWDRAELADGSRNTVAFFYGSCDHQAPGADEIRAQLHGFPADRE